MSLRLILMRHAKSDWDDPMASDHQRVLNARGRQNASALGVWLAQQGYRPDLALVSDASRTGETWLRVSQAWAEPPEVRFQAAFYNAGPDLLLRAIRAATVPCLLVLAHNPGIGMLAEHLSATAPAHSRFADYPTGSTLVLDFDAPSWADIGKGQLRGFVIPADLPA
jgi:phosphohistidine phosphatase